MAVLLTIIKFGTIASACQDLFIRGMIGELLRHQPWEKLSLMKGRMSGAVTLFLPIP